MSLCTSHFNFYCSGDLHPPPHPPVLHANGSRARALPAEVQQHDRTFWTAKRNASAPVSSTHGARPHPSSTCLLQQLSQAQTSTRNSTAFLRGRDSLVRFLNTSPAPWGFMTCIFGPVLFASIASNCTLNLN